MAADASDPRAPALGARVAWIVGLAALYVVTARLGLLLDAVSGFATLVWPPTGIALVALSRRGRWLWPGVALGAFVVNVWVGASPLIALGIAVGNTLEAVAGCELIRLSHADARLSRVGDVAKLVLVVTVASTAAGATIGVGSLALGGALRATFATTWVAWWLGDAMGDLVVAPLLFAWLAASRRTDTDEARPAAAHALRTGEAAAVSVLLVAAGVVVFGGLLGPGRGARLMYLLFPPLIWSVTRFGTRGGTAAVLWVSTMAVAGTAIGHGPFAHQELHRGLIELQSFMAVVAITMLILGAAIAERDRARREAVAAVGARDEFLSIAAHELRTPLSALLLQIAGLRSRVRQDDDSGGRVDRAERQTERLAQLVTNLLDVSRIESGQLAIDPARVDLAEVVREAADRTREEAARAGCTLSIRVDGPVVGSWDRMRIEQLLGNLLANAYRHAAGRPVEVSLAADERTVRIVVRDHGDGIPEDRREAIFERFHRGAAARERGGLGLGLYIARHLAVAHGGGIAVRAERDEGSSFVVELPRPPPPSDP